MHPRRAGLSSSAGISCYKTLSKSTVTSSTTYLFPVCTDCFLRKRSTFSSNGVRLNFIFWAYQALIFMDRL